MASSQTSLSDLGSVIEHLKASVASLLAAAEATDSKLLRMKSKLLRMKSKLLRMKSKLAAFKTKLAGVTIELAGLNDKLTGVAKTLVQARKELSHPLESFVVAAICEELLRLIYFHEKTSWMKKFKPSFQPQEGSWSELGIPKTLFDALKKDAARNVSSTSAWDCVYSCTNMRCVNTSLCCAGVCAPVHCGDLYPGIGSIFEVAAPAVAHKILAAPESSEHASCCARTSSFRGPTCSSRHILSQGPPRSP